MRVQRGQPTAREDGDVAEHAALFRPTLAPAPFRRPGQSGGVGESPNHASREPLARARAGPSTSRSKTRALHSLNSPFLVSATAISFACCSFSAITVA